MPPPDTSENGWERWRGEVTANAKHTKGKLSEIGDDIQKIFTLFEKHTEDDKRDFAAVKREVRSINLKLAKWSGVIVIVVAIAVLVIPELMRKYL